MARARKVDLAAEASLKGSNGGYRALASGGYGRVIESRRCRAKPRGVPARGPLGWERAIAVVTIGVASLVATSSVAAVASSHRARTIRHRYRLADGVTLTTIRYPRAPNEVRVLTLTQGHGAVPDVLPAGARYPAYLVPSRLAWGAGALAAVNDDFSVQGRPKHMSMIDGEVWTTGIQPQGAAFAFSANGQRAYIGEPHPAITVHPAGASSFDVDRWNAGSPRRAQMAAFSLRGGTIEAPPGDPSPTASSPRWCAARLVPTGPIGWAGADHDRLGRPFVVDAQPEPCPKTPIGRGDIAGTVVLASRAPAADGTIVPLRTDQEVDLRWRMQGWPRAVDVIGGTPMLVHDGVDVAPGYHPGDPYIFNNNPRTAVGISDGCEDPRRSTICKVFIVTVDGRQSGWSRGMRFPDLARVFLHLGADEAFNLDGGGSTEAWIADRRPSYCEDVASVGGCFANRPSDGNERPAVMSLALLPGRDTGDPVG